MATELLKLAALLASHRFARRHRRRKEVRRRWWRRRGQCKRAIAYLHRNESYQYDLRVMGSTGGHQASLMKDRTSPPRRSPDGQHLLVVGTFNSMSAL